MTENEFVEQKQSVLKSMDDSVCFTREEAEILERALEEFEAYRAIGTIEECRTAVGRMKPKKVKGISVTHEGYVGNCPSCNKFVRYMENSKFCECSQRLDWSE